MSATVAIITRTKNRPLLLRRAAESVAMQSYNQYTWIVVNDGGNEAEVREVLAACDVDQSRIHLVSNSLSVGMEAAANIGIRHSESDYVLIHDDDDTIERSFLEETVGYLESPEGQRFGGVTTKVEYVSEEILGGDIIVHARRPYMDWIHSIELSELLAQNTVTTIGFIYRRDVFDAVGGYREDLPVLGDWYFNIQFVLRADIKVLPRTLAYYHHRDRASEDSAEQYANSVVEGHDQHREFGAICRNMLIREFLQEGGFASAIVMGYFGKELRIASNQSQTGPGGEPATGEIEARNLAELDRLWLLSLILYRKAHQRPLFGDRIPTIAPDVSLGKLAQMAQKYQVEISAPSNFNEATYLKRYPDVAQAIADGRLQSGYEHYALSGHLEGRRRANS